MFTKLYWKNLAERVVASAAGGALAVLGADTVIRVDITSLGTLLAGAASGALFSLLKGLAATQINNPQSPSLVDLSVDEDTPGKHAVDRVR